MQLLGNYTTNLSSYQFQELVTLLQASIQLGEYSGGFTFNQTNLEALQTQAQAFNTLPEPSAGNRSSDDSFNNPINLLSARFSAILSETTSFEQTLNNLITLLQSNTTLIDKLICSAQLENWKNTLPVLNSNKFSWDFGTGYGPIADPLNIWAWTDPLTNVYYGKKTPPLISTVIGNGVFTGLSCNTENTSFAPTNLNWSSSYQNNSVQSGLDWTELTISSGKQLITYSGSPIVSPINPYYQVTGISNLGGLPIYVRIGHTLRVNMLNSNSLVNGTPINISSYEIDTSQVFVTQQSSGIDLFEYPNSIGNSLPVINSYYVNGVDYTITSEGVFTPISLPTGVNINIQFVENFPSYQCSTDQIHWSSLYMLDPLRPYQDGETLFAPFTFGSGNSFPITDENNVPTGLYLSIIGPTTEDYMLQVYSTANINTVGATAVLEIDFGGLNILNSIVINPFTSFPLILTSVTVEGLTPQLPIWVGSVVINKETTLRFPSAIISKIYLSFLQPSFSIVQTENTDSGNINLRRDIIQQLQQNIPTLVQITNNTPSVVSSSYVYEFGLQNISGQYLEPSSGIYTLGPYTSVGIPDIVSLNLDYTDSAVIPLSENLQVNAVQGSNSINVISGSGYTIGQTSSSFPVTSPPTVVIAVSGNLLTISNPVVSALNNETISLTYDSPIDTYLCYIAYDSSGTIIDENALGVQISSGTPIVFPFNGIPTDMRSSVANVDLYLKICHRNSEAILQRFQLEVINA